MILTQWGTPPGYAGGYLLRLEGEAGDRALTVARLMTDGSTPRLLVTRMHASPIAVRPAYLHWCAQVLAEQGLPLGRIIDEGESTNSWK